MSRRALTRIALPRLACVVLLAAGLGAAVAQSAFGAKELLVPVKAGSALYQKVVVVSPAARLVTDRPGGSDSKKVRECTIYHRLKTDSGATEEKAAGAVWWRVGTRDGTPQGWIKAEYLREWSTRFVLDPLGVADDIKPFPVLHPRHKTLPEERKVQVTYNGAKKDDRALAFVTAEPNDDEEYPVVYYIGPISDTKDETEIDNLALEVAFVVEMTDFMSFKWSSGVTSLDLLKETVLDIAKSAEQSRKSGEGVSFAVVQYQDTVEKQMYVADVVTPQFVSGAKNLERAVSGLRPAIIGGDFPEDGIAGLEQAVTRLPWKGHSSKHVILIAQGALQTQKDGEQQSLFGHFNNFISRPKGQEHRFGNKEEPYSSGVTKYGWSSTGLNVAGLVAKANQGRNASAAGLESLKQIKTLHTILMGRPLILPQETQQLVDTILGENDDQIQSRYENAADRDKFINALLLASYVKQGQQCRVLAKAQFEELARNGTSELLGCCLTPEPTMDGVKQASREIQSKLDEAFKVFATVVAEGEVTSAQSRNEFARSLVQIAKAYKDDLGNKDVVSGLSPARDGKGREVAKVKILVYKDELDALRSTLNEIETRFRDYKGDRQKRQNATDVLRALKTAIAGKATGQELEFKDDTQLNTLVGELPMKTPVLSTTARAIAQMSNEDFDRWLGQLKYSQERCRDLLDQWGTGEFGFFEQSQMP
jgi:hypothetical protein